MDLRSRIKIDLSLFVALTKYNTFSIFKIHVSPVELDQLSDTNPGRGKQIDHCEVTGIVTVVTHQLQRLIRVCLFDRLAGLDLMDSSDRTFHDVVLVLQPREEGRQNTAHIIQCDLADRSSALVGVEIGAQVLCCDLLLRLADCLQHIADGRLVVAERLLRAALHTLCSDECG